jgi:hypothetical protein
MTSTNTNTLYAALIPADITKPVTVVEITPDLSSMYPIIGCSIVQPMTVPSKMVENAVLWCDEEALCVDAPVFNARASILVRYPIFGDTILAGDNGEKVVTLSLPCPKVFFDILQQEAEKFVKVNGTISPQNAVG